jgi:hypothetical protein
MDVPVTPEPIMTTSASAGNFGDCIFARSGWGERSQKEDVGFGVGSPGSDSALSRASWRSCSGIPGLERRDWTRNAIVIVYSHLCS